MLTENWKSLWFQLSFVLTVADFHNNNLWCRQWRHCDNNVFFSGHCIVSLRWRQNDHDGVSNHQPHGCLLNRLFRRTSKKTSKLRVTGLCAGNSPGPVNSPHKGPVTRKMFPFDDVITFTDFVDWNLRVPTNHMIWCDLTKWLYTCLEVLVSTTRVDCPIGLTSDRSVHNKMC